METLKLGSDEYEVIPKAAVTASKILVDVYEKLGKPDDPFSDAGKKVMDIIISLWQDLYPLEAKMWFEDRQNHLNEEMTTREQVWGKTGRSLASIPSPVYRMMRKVFPEFKMDHREDFIKLVKEYPIFRMVNKI